MPRKSASAADLLRGRPAEVVALCERLRALVMETVPDVEERVALGWGALNYHAPGCGLFCGIFPGDDRVKLLFEHGMRLPGAERVLPMARSQVRWIELRPGDAIPEAALVRLLILASQRVS